jgi:hypothetical protein
MSIGNIRAVARMIYRLITAIAFVSFAGGCSSPFAASLEKVASNASSPKSGSISNILDASSPVVISFSKAMDPSTLKDSGTLLAESQAPVWTSKSAANDTLTFSPKSTWTTNSWLSLVVDCSTPDGYAVSEITLNFGIVDHVIYVSASTGADSNPGTTSMPMQTIQAGLSAAKALYSKAEVRVAEGQYSIGSKDAAIVLTGGMSLKGGYSMGDWSVRDSSSHVSTIISTTTQIGASVFVASKCSSITLDGFSIKASGNATTLVYFDTVSDFSINSCAIGGLAASVVGSTNGIYLLKSSGTLEGDSFSSSSSVGVDSILINAELCAKLELANISIVAGGGCSGKGTLTGLSLIQSVARMSSLSATFSGTISHIQGISLDESSKLTLQGGSISFLPDDCADSSYGIYSTDALELSVSDLTISYAGSSSDAVGIYCLGGALTACSDSFFFSTGTSSVDCVRLYEANATIYNCVLSASSALESLCSFSFCSDLELFNNLFSCNKAPILGLVSLSSCSKIDIENNIFIGQASSTSGIRTDLTWSLPTRLMNNDLWINGYLIFNYSPMTTTTDVESTENLETTKNKTAGGNIEANPQLSSDWKPTSKTPAEITQGGINLSMHFSTDAAGASRTDPWSMGPYI